MTYIILELFPEPFIVNSMDGKVWKTNYEVATNLAEECQQGTIVPLNVEIVNEFSKLLNEIEIEIEKANNNS